MILYILIYVNVLIGLSSSALHYHLLASNWSVLIMWSQYWPLISQWPPLLASDWLVLVSSDAWCRLSWHPTPVTSWGWWHPGIIVTCHHPGSQGCLSQSEASIEVTWPILTNQRPLVCQAAGSLVSVTHVQLKLHSLSQHCNALVLTWCSLCQTFYLSQHSAFWIWCPRCGLWLRPGHCWQWD